MILCKVIQRVIRKVLHRGCGWELMERVVLKIL